MKALIWGGSSYTTADDERRMSTRLEGLGVQWQRSEADAPPPLEGVDILVVHSKARVDAALLERHPSLSLVITTTSGYDHVDVARARTLDVRVARCPLARRDAVIETSVAMGLSLLRDLPGLHRRAEAGIWARAELADRSLRLVRGLGVGVMGYGVIGRRAVEVWGALGARVLYSDPAVPGSATPEEILEHATVFTLHCSLTPSSDRLVNAEFLARMTPGSILINTARGSCVDLAALSEARHLGGVALDVFPEEPWSDLKGLAARNAIITPHASGYHDGLGAAIAQELGDTIEAFVSGQALPHEVSLYD